MSTPKPYQRNHSFVFKRDYSNKRISSRERILRESDDFIIKKRFKIQPYSSFEDKFIEQDKLNKYIFEQFSRLESKILEYTQNTSEKETFQQSIDFFTRKFEDISSEVSISKQKFQELSSFKDSILHSINSNESFKEKCSQKDQILFEELIRLGKSLESNEQKIEEICQKSIKPGKIQVLSDNIVGIDEKVKTIENIYEALKSSIESESAKIQRLSLSSQSLRNDIETYMSQVNTTVSSNLSSAADIILKKLLDEQENRQKNIIDLKYIIDINYSKLNEKFSAELIGVKTILQKLEADIGLVRNGNEEDFGKLRENLKKDKKGVVNLIEIVRSQIRIIENQQGKNMDIMEKRLKEVTESFSSTILAEMQTRVHAENELQNMIKITTKSIFQEINETQSALRSLETESEKNNSQLRNSISEKCDLLSRYMETEIRKIKKNFSNNIKKYQSVIPRDVDVKIEVLKKQFVQIFNALKKDSLNRFDFLIKTHEKITFEIEKLSKEVNHNLEKITEELDYFSENLVKFDENIVKLDEKIVKIDENSYNDLTSITQYLADVEEEILEIRADKNFYQEIIAGLEAQIEVKITNEKVSREHMIAFYVSSIQEDILIQGLKTQKKLDLFSKKFVKASEFDLVIEKIELNKENFIEISKTFDSFKENIKAEVNEYFEESNRVQGKIDTALLIVDEMKERIQEVVENHTKFGVMLRSALKQQDKEKYMSESKSLLVDMTNRVETMGILSKLDGILVDMDANERETQAMLTLYKKELEYIQEKQKKGLEDAQNAVRSIFDSKISGVQNMVSSELSKIIDYIEKNQVLAPNLSSLHEYASNVKIIPHPHPN